MKLLNVTLVRTDNWNALYSYGKLLTARKTIDWEDLLSTNVVHLSQTFFADQAWFDKEMKFPYFLSDVVKKVD